jgi:hypothetical protein
MAPHDELDVGDVIGVLAWQVVERLPDEAVDARRGPFRQEEPLS